jgi:polyisoprenoid-binding protein YceI
VKGTFGVLSGEVTIADPVTASTAQAVIDAASFSGGHPQRDKDVKSANFLHVQEHPHITFESSQLARDGDGWVMRGQLTVRGNAAPVELTVTESRATGDGLTLRGTTRIDRYAFGRDALLVPYPGDQADPRSWCPQRPPAPFPACAAAQPA